jgi:hypothetical protein
MAKKHPNVVIKHPAATDGLDLVRTHSQHLLTLGLCKIHQQECIRWGAGDKLMELYKLMTVWCKALGLNNYAVALLELQLQLRVLPPRLAHDIMWNRSVNHQKKPNTNHPLDLALEHCNGQVKSMLSSYRGEYTANHLARVSRGSDLRTAIDQKHKSAVEYKRTKGYHRKRDTCSDALMLVGRLQDHDLFGHQPGRCYRSCNVEPGLLHVAPRQLTQWAKEHIRVWQTKPYYQ